jgi:hypothetical protein
VHTERDVAVLRDLARRIADIADEPVMAERIALWKRHNALQPARAMILVFPEGSWAELVPDAVLCCKDPKLRRIEQDFRRTLHQHAHFDCDNVVTREFGVDKVVYTTGWGLDPQWDHSTTARGSRKFHPVLLEPADLKKLRMPELTYDEDATQEQLAEAQDMFGDILDVRIRGVHNISYHPLSLYTARRGLAEAMMDMAAEPGLIHDALTFFTEGYKHCMQQMVDMNLLDLNNDNSYHNSGGNGWTDELPPADCDPARVRPADMWGSAEAQEMAQVSPEMHEEFALRYEKELLAPFGLTGYGCCEDLTRKLDYVFEIPNIRRISISPWADVDVCAEKLKGDYIFSWKPHPAHLVGRFDTERLRAYIEHTVRVAAENGCVLEMILKDTHTCEHHPERFDEWTRVAREVIDAMGVSE